MPADTVAAPSVPEVDVLVAGLGPGGCAAALAARAEGLRTLAVEARGPEAQRSQLVLVRPGAQAVLRQLGLPDITEGRRTTTIRHVENRLRSALVSAAEPDPAVAPAPAKPRSPLTLCWHTSVAGLELAGERVVATLRDEADGALRQVSARHVVDAAGGRLEPLGLPSRVRVGPSHLVMTAEYAAPPWFDGIVGVRDATTHELYLLFPTWGRRGVIAYFDSLPGSAVDSEAMVRRFEAIAERLALGVPRQPVWAVDVYQRALERPSRGRIVPIGDAVGTVDALLGAGMSTAIEDGADAVRAIGAAQRETSARRELARTLEVSARLFSRHRSMARRGRLLLAVRPILERAWPTAVLPDITRDTVGPPPLLWPAVRFVFGRRPQASS